MCNLHTTRIFNRFFFVLLCLIDWFKKYVKYSRKKREINLHILIALFLCCIVVNKEGNMLFDGDFQSLNVLTRERFKCGKGLYLK